MFIFTNPDSKLTCFFLGMETRIQLHVHHCGRTSAKLCLHQIRPHLSTHGILVGQGLKVSCINFVYFWGVIKNAALLIKSWIMLCCHCSGREGSSIHYSQLSLNSWLDFANILIFTIFFLRKKKRSLEENQSSEHTQQAGMQIQIRKCFQLEKGCK